MEVDLAKFKVITSRSNQGFFTQLFHTLQHLESAEREGMIPIVYWSGGIYENKGGYNGVKTRNMWEYFWEPVSKHSFDKMYPKARANKYGDFFADIKDKNIQFVSKFRNKSLDYEPKDCWNTRLFPPETCLLNPNIEGRKYINSLIHKHTKLRKVVTDKVDEFYKKNMEGCKVASVHIRACNDHEPAQGHKMLIRYIKRIEKFININDGEKVKIFVATDYQKVLNKLIKLFGDHIIYREDGTRSENGHPLQYACQSKKKNKPPGAKVFEDALLDCLLLTKGEILLRGFSNVSAAATFYNTKIESIYVPRYNKKDKDYLGIA